MHVVLKPFLIKDSTITFFFPVAKQLKQLLFYRCSPKKVDELGSIFINIFRNICIHVFHVFTEKLPILSFFQFRLVQRFKIVQTDLCRFTSLTSNIQYIHVFLYKIRLTISFFIRLTHGGIPLPINSTPTFF